MCVVCVVWVCNGTKNDKSNHNYNYFLFVIIIVIVIIFSFVLFLFLFLFFEFVFASPDPPPPDPPPPWTPLRWTAQNFALFFSPAENFILSSLSGGSSGEILVVFEALVHVWSARAVV